MKSTPPASKLRQVNEKLILTLPSELLLRILGWILNNNINVWQPYGHRSLSEM